LIKASHMVGCLAKTRKVGGPIVVTLPKELVEAQNIKENQCVEITVKKSRTNGFGIFRAMSPFTAADEIKGQLE
jgi:antitoxin component of MazEF toxin-antitoxin module